ncbi:MAG TPA: porin [Fimbriiglobus sp.]|nr:porin [Fimbriiglobus sp.]
MIRSLWAAAGAMAAAGVAAAQGPVAPAALPEWSPAMCVPSVSVPSADGGWVGPTGSPKVPVPSTPGANPPTGVRDPTEPTALKPVWKNQLVFENDDKSFSLFVGGRAQFDVAGYLAPRTIRSAVTGTEPLDDGVHMRRLRFQVGGSIHRNYEFLVEVDFANNFVTEAGTDRSLNTPVPTDAWFTFKEVPIVGNVRVGHQKPPISFEHMTSSRFLNFMERSPGFDAFVENQANGFQPGVSAFDTYADRRGTWAAGLFKNTRNVFGWSVGRNEAEVTGRVTYLPVYEADGRQLVHVGLGASHRDAEDDTVRARSRFSIRNAPGAVAPLMADTGDIDARQQQVVVPEFVAVSGPFSLQSEYYLSWVQAAQSPAGSGFGRGTAFFQSAYVEAHYFLTGEHRPYNRDRGVFDRVVPHSPFSWRRGCGASGWGAWQLAARYSYLDLNSRGIEGGIIHDLTLGLNWFLNPNAKVQLNYFLAHRDVPGVLGDGYIQGFGTRMAWDF